MEGGEVLVVVGGVRGGGRGGGDETADSALM